jgi:hypothetical protein
MSTPYRGILVRGELSVWYAVGIIAGIMALIGGGIMVACQVPAGWAIGAAGLVAALSVASVALRLWLERTWLEDQGAGIVVRDRRGERQIADEQIVALALDVKKYQVQGELKGNNRTLKVWVDNSPAPIVMANYIRTGHPDPIGIVIERLVAGLSSRMNSDIDRGGSAVGDGWRLEKSHFHCGASMDHAIPLAEVVAVDVFEQKMCVWRRGEDAAVFKAPLASRNAHLLPLLLESRFPSPDQQKESPSSTGLGRILFERRPQMIGVALCAFFSAGAAVGGVVALGANAGKIEGVLLLLAGLGVSALFAVAAVAQRFMVFRCHERGVYKASLLGQRLLPYASVATFTYSATKHYHNGAYVGTQLSMKFEPLAGSGAPKISYGASVNLADDDLEELRDFISRQLADRMAEHLSTGQPVQWTPNLVFTREGIQYRPAGMLGIGRKEPHFLPYDAYGGCNVNEGTFYLFVKGNNSAVMTEPCSAANFYPGFYMLLMMTAKSDA